MGPFAGASFILGTANNIGILNPAFRMFGQLGNEQWPNELPAPDDLFAANRAGLLSDADLGQILNYLGISSPNGLPAMTGSTEIPGSNFPRLARAWGAVFNNKLQIPAPGDLLQMANQAIITEDYLTTCLRRLGFWDRELRGYMRQLSQNVIPGPDALVSFALREAWDQVTVARFQYDAEFPPEFGLWMAAQGADGLAPAGGPGGQAAGAPTWSKLYWRTHWTAISPNLAYEMFQRLREGRWQRYAAGLPGLRAFTFADLQQVLKINDYPVPFRPQLAAIAYRRPRLVDIDRFYQTGAINADEVYEYHLDLGYSPADARIRTDWLTTKNIGSTRAAARLNPIAAIMQTYTLGLADAGTTADQLLSALSGGQFTSMHMPPAAANQQNQFQAYTLTVQGLIERADLQIAVQKGKEILVATKKQFLRGIISDVQAVNQLIAGGFTADRARGYADSWRRVLQSGRLLLSTSNIRKLVIEQVMPLATAQKYLGNLGWKDPEITYITQELQRDMAIEQQRIAARQARTQAQAQAAQQRLIRSLQIQQQRLVSQLNRQATPTQLYKYVVRGIITPDQYSEELKRRGIDAAEIARRQALAQQDRIAYLQRRARTG